MCGMDTLYNSVTFCKACYMHPKKVNTQVTFRKGGRVIPCDIVLQQEVTSIKGQREVRVMVKSAVLHSDTECPNIGASNIYGKRTVHFLSVVCNSIKWVIKSKKLYSVDSGEVEQMDFLRLNQTDDPNKTMGGVDIADQLIGAYRTNQWLFNRNWWWSIWNWSL